MLFEVTGVKTEGLLCTQSNVLTERLVYFGRFDQQPILKVKGEFEAEGGNVLH